MKQYPKYEDSGVEWIGDVPKEWEVTKIRRFCQVKRGASPRPIDDQKYFDDSGEFAWVRIADVSASNKYLYHTTQTLSELGSSLSVKKYPDELFLSIAGTVGKPIISKIKCCIHDGFVYFDNLSLYHEFLYYIFSSGRPYLGLGKWGTQLNLNTDTVADIKIPIPSYNNQVKIATFLDHKTHQIDDLIAKKQKLKELLKEERTELINKAVTKGLNPTVPLKDSGIEWFGEIPKHWKLTNIKKITTKIGSGVTPKGGADVYVETGIPFFRSQNIHFSGIRTDEIVFIPIDVHEKMSASKMNKDDVLLNITGASIGRCCVYEGQLGEANVNQHVCILRTTPHVNPYILYYFLSSEVGQIQIDLGNTGSGREGLNFKNIGNFVFPMIPPDEQIQMVKYLNEMNKSIETVIIKADKEIELLSEYKTSLINEAVTGKIDVRDYQISHA